jgi:hypothetical protein
MPLQVGIYVVPVVAKCPSMTVPEGCEVRFVDPLGMAYYLCTTVVT